MATPKKKHLIELMVEACVKWPEGAEYAAQDKNKELWFFEHKKPWLVDNRTRWYGSDEDRRFAGDGVELPSPCRNRHQTIVTREQYEEAVARSRTENFTATPPETFMCRCAAAPLSMTIEQLTADYHTKAAEADRLQSVADEALKEADDALLALEKAGELIGLIISIDTKPKQVAQQCNRAEWKIGDNCIVTDSPDVSDWVGRECVLIRIDARDESMPYKVVDKEEQEEFWVRSIRRP